MTLLLFYLMCPARPFTSPVPLRTVNNMARLQLITSTVAIESCPNIKQELLLTLLQHVLLPSAHLPGIKYNALTSICHFHFQPESKTCLHINIEYSRSLPYSLRFPSSRWSQFFQLLDFDPVKYG